jgi:hypothetical protein
MSAAFTTPAAKKAGSSSVIGSWVVFFPQSARLPHPEGWRIGLGSGLPMTSWFKGVPVERLAQEQVFASVFVFAL